MAIFNSYVKLPEGNQYCRDDFLRIPGMKCPWLSPISVSNSWDIYLKTLVAKQKRYPGSTQHRFELYLITLW